MTYYSKPKTSNYDYCLTAKHQHHCIVLCRKDFAFSIFHTFYLWHFCFLRSISIEFEGHFKNAYGSPSSFRTTPLPAPVADWQECPLPAHLSLRKSVRTRNMGEIPPQYPHQLGPPQSPAPLPEPLADPVCLSLNPTACLSPRISVLARDTGGLF